MKKPKKLLLTSVFCTGMLSLSACGKPQSVYGPPQTEPETTVTEAETEAETEAATEATTAAVTEATTEEATDTTTETTVTEQEDAEPSVSNLETKPTAPAMVYGPPVIDEAPETIPGSRTPSLVYGPPQAYEQ